MPGSWDRIKTKNWSLVAGLLLGSKVGLPSVKVAARGFKKILMRVGQGDYDIQRKQEEKRIGR